MTGETNVSSSSSPASQKSGILMNSATSLWSSDLEDLFVKRPWGYKCNSTVEKWCQYILLVGHSLNHTPRYYYNLSLEYNNTAMTRKFGFYCQSLGKNYAFVRLQKLTFKIVTGPEKVLLSSLQCINIVYDGPTDGGHMLHFLFGGRRVKVKGCKVTQITPNCFLNTTDTGILPVPGYGNYSAAVYTLFLQNIDSSTTCEIELPCINKDKQLMGGAFSMKGYFTKATLLPSFRTRKLLSLTGSPPEDSCGSHSHFKKTSSHHLITDFKDGPGKVISICNGTHFFHGRMPQDKGCYSIRSIETSHHCVYKKPECLVEPELKECTQGKCIMVRMSVSGIIKLTRGETVETIRCNKECLLPPLQGSGDILIDCPGGTQHFLQKNIIDLQCPSSKYFQEALLYTCRMSNRPKTTVFFFFWLSVGYILLSVFCSLVFYLLKAVCFAVEKTKLKLTHTKTTCKACKLDVVGSTSKKLHEANCENGLCPFCANRLPMSNLNRHASMCPKRKLVEEAIAEHDSYALTPWLFVFFFGLSEYAGTVIKRTVWAVLLVVLLLVVISPVRGNLDIDFDGLGDGYMEPGLWEEEAKLVEDCHQECFITESECVCPQFESGRKLLFFHMLKKAVREDNKHKLLSSLSLDTPWGLVKIEKSFRPTQSVANLQLSWSSEEEVGDKVVLSGKSTAILQLVERTGAVWELSSGKALEKKKLVVSIMDFSQEYRSQFEYLTGDRTVSEWPKATCTGPCPDRCSCHTSTCLWKAWPNSRKWTCNPTWCWGVGTGCTCCGMDIEKPFQNYLVSKWQLEYIKTDVVVCVELTDFERHCDLVHAGSRFNLGPVTVIVSDPQNVQRKLPPGIAAFHKAVGGEVDLMHVAKLTTSTNLCKLQSCTHGAPGDMQMYRPNYLVKYSTSNRINYMENTPIANDTWVSWQGCDLDYYCTTGSWPTCTFTGVVKQNTDAFKNLENTEIDFMQDYFFHSTRVIVGGDHLDMSVKARPKEGAGELTVLVEVDGLELHSKLITPEGLFMKISSCSGCYSCSTGFLCDISVGVETPPELSVHFECSNPNIVISEGSILASSTDRIAKLKAFSSLKKTEFCLILTESKLTKKIVKDCITLNLDDPKDIILETRGTLTSHQNDTCSAHMGCWFVSAGLFFSGLSQFFRDYFGSFLLGLLVFLIPVLLLILFFCFGSRIFFCRRCKPCFRANQEDREKFKKLIETMRKPNFTSFLNLEDKGSWRRLANTALGKVKKEG
uniref:M polyprotein n=1 Tax=Crocidura tanakae nairovirus 1 TaxID=3139554 RepID=A0AB38ZK68_9VIRU